MKTKEEEREHCERFVQVSNWAVPAAERAKLVASERAAAREEMKEAVVHILASLTSNAVDSCNNDMLAAYDRAYSAIRALKTGVEK